METGEEPGRRGEQSTCCWPLVFLPIWLHTDLPPLPFTFQTYFGMDVSAVEDPVQRRALETMIKTYGQTPRQLFQAAHVSRPGPRLSLEGELPAAVGLLVQFAFRETREPVREAPHPVGHVEGTVTMSRNPRVLWPSWAVMRASVAS